MKVAVIGAGASGLMAAYAAAMKGNEVTVYEKNSKCGKKIYITGKGRCNVTNLLPAQEFLLSVVNNAKFLTGAIYSFPPERMYAFLEDGGCRLKTERGNRVFPVSDKASDITKCLQQYCERAGVVFKFDSKVQDISILNSTVSGIIVDNNFIPYEKVIVCTGGLSYPSTGSDGDGYRFAAKSGHGLIAARPALCGMNVKGSYCAEMQGLSLKNVKLTVYFGQKKLSEEMGEMLFTHFGISGPLVLTASSLITRLDLNSVKLSLDLKPALDEQTLDRRLLRDFGENSNKSIFNCLKNLLPVAIIGDVLKRAGIPSEKKVNNVSRAERVLLLTTVKNFDILISSLRGFEEAIITSGGVNVKYINPKTMQSKLVDGLYFCGEVLDVDAFTGGFNLQIAFATGFAAGNSIG